MSEGEKQMPGGAPRAKPRRVAHYLWVAACIVAVPYIIFIGFFAINQIQQRDDTRQAIADRIDRITLQLLVVGPANPGSEGQAHTDERAALLSSRKTLESLQARVRALISVGAMTQRGTLPLISCDLLKMTEPMLDCEDSRPQPSTERLLAGVIERTASNTLLAFLVVVAAIAGGLVRGTLNSDNVRWSLPEVVRAAGGGIACYLALAGGTVTATKFAETSGAAPATWSLLGFLSGIFASRVFRLLSELVDAFVARLSPRRSGDQSSVGRSPSTPPASGSRSDER